MDKYEQVALITSPEGVTLEQALAHRPNRHERRAQDAWLRRKGFMFPGRKLRNRCIRKMDADS